MFAHAFEIAVDYPEGRRQTDVLIVTWSFSHAVFMMVLPNQQTESVLTGMVAAFAFFQAVAREVWWDNPKTIATVVLRGRERVLNEDYAALASSSYARTSFSGQAVNSNCLLVKYTWNGDSRLDVSCLRNHQHIGLAGNPGVGAVDEG